MPGSGTISYLRTPEQDLPRVRVDTGIREGDTVSVFYDPMIAKLITWDTTRERAMQQVFVAVVVVTVVLFVIVVNCLAFSNSPFLSSPPPFFFFFR